MCTWRSSHNFEQSPCHLSPRLMKALGRSLRCGEAPPMDPGWRPVAQWHASPASDLSLWNIGSPMTPMLLWHHATFPIQSVWSIKQSLHSLMPASLQWCWERRRSFGSHGHTAMALPSKVYTCIDSPKPDRGKSMIIEPCSIGHNAVGQRSSHSHTHR